MAPHAIPPAPALGDPLADRPLSGTSGGRADALDALRGFAILTMALSGLVPWGTLPAWMYHAQLPPPACKFNPAVAGLTWVDLVFPFFLFALGAALPLALERRRREGTPGWSLALHALQRGLLLAFFALYVEQVRPHRLSASPGAAQFGAALALFVPLFPLLARLPRHWPRWRHLATRLVGWSACVGFLIWQHRAAEDLKWLRQFDIIIVVLANMAVFGTLLWLLTADRLPLRIALLVGLVAVRLGASVDGWVKVLWDGTWLPSPLREYVHAYTQLWYLQYLHIVLPGTIAGELLLRRLHAPPGPALTRGALFRAGLLALLCAGLLVWVLVGLQSRWVRLTPAVAAAACAAGALLVRNPRSTLEDLLRGLYGWAVFWLLIGLILEPYEGGIKKDRATLSYYYVTSGLAGCALIFFTVLIDGYGVRRPLYLLIASGQNPMIAYAGIHNLMRPLVELSGLQPAAAAWLKGKSPWLGVLWAAAKTVLLAALTSIFTRLRVFWRT